MSASCIICYDDAVGASSVKPCSFCSPIVFCVKCWNEYMSHGYHACPQCRTVLACIPPSSSQQQSDPIYRIVYYYETPRLRDLCFLQTLTSCSSLFMAALFGHGLFLTRVCLCVVSVGCTYMLRFLQSPTVPLGFTDRLNAMVFMIMLASWLLSILNVIFCDHCTEFLLFTVASLVLVRQFLHYVWYGLKARSERVS